MRFSSEKMKSFFALVLAVALGATSAFTPATRMSRATVSMNAEPARREFLGAAAAAAAAVVPLAANADVDYDGIKYLGGGDQIDLNNANIRAYLRLKGMYPGAAGKIASNKKPYKSVGDVYATPGLTDAEKTVIKKYESRFVVLEPKAEYVIDRMNNGLYR